MTTSLHGASILVTRPAGQAENLCDLIARQGGIALKFPTLEIAAVTPEPELLQHALAGDWLIFTSTNAVDFANQAFDGKMPALRKLRIAAVGQATAKALREAGWPVDCVPESEFSSEGLLAEPPLQNVAGLQCTIVRGVGGREKLADGLRARGAELDYLEVYRRCRPEPDSGELKSALADQRLVASTVTSVEALHNLLAMLDGDAVQALRDLWLVAASDRIAAEAEHLGFKRVAVSKQPSDAAILETLTTLLNGENSGRSN